MNCGEGAFDDCDKDLDAFRSPLYDKDKDKHKDKHKEKDKDKHKSKVPMMIATKTLMHFVLFSPRKPASLSTCLTTENNF